MLVFIHGLAFRSIFNGPYLYKHISRSLPISCDKIVSIHETEPLISSHINSIERKAQDIWAISLGIRVA
jgi:hypothetical protein